MFGHRFFGAAFFGPHYWGPGTSTPVPPTPTPTPQGGGKGKRRYVRLSNGETREIHSDRDLYDIARTLIDRQPEKPKKRGPKKGKKPQKPGILLNSFASWNTLYDELAVLDAQFIEERLILDMMLGIMAREAIRQDDEDFMAILQMMI